MSRIPEEIISQMLNQTSLEEIIFKTMGKEHFTRKGGNFFALCPFHQEKTPSFSISPSKQFFHCFGCSISGNVFSFLMKYHGISFPESIQKLAELEPSFQKLIAPYLSFGKRPNFKNIIDSYIASKTSARDKIAILQILNVAHTFFQKQLRNNPRIEVKKARKYLQSRSINKKLEEKLGIGFALPKDFIVHYLFSKLRTNFTNDNKLYKLIVRSGIVGNKGDCNLQNKLTFPISDLNGNIIGFTARKIQSKKVPNKYIHFEDRELFKKSKILNGLGDLDLDLVEQQGLYLVEGELDRGGFLMQDLRNCLTVGGTNYLSREQVKLIMRLNPRKIYLLADGGDAGIRSNIRNAEILTSFFDTLIIHMEDNGYDPFDLFYRQKKSIVDYTQNNAMTPYDYYKLYPSKVEREPDFDDDERGWQKDFFKNHSSAKQIRIKSNLAVETYANSPEYHSLELVDFGLTPQAPFTFKEPEWITKDFPIDEYRWDIPNKERIN